MIKKPSVLAAIAGFAALAGVSSAAQAQCVNCSYSTYYRPVTVKHCRHVVARTVLQPVVTQQVVPVVRYQTVQRVQYVPQTYYSSYTTSTPVQPGYGYGYAAPQAVGYPGLLPLD